METQLMCTKKKEWKKHADRFAQLFADFSLEITRDISVSYRAD